MLYLASDREETKVDLASRFDSIEELDAKERDVNAGRNKAQE